MTTLRQSVAVWVGIAVAAFGAPLAAGPLETTLARIDQAAAGFKGLTADLKMTSHTDVINENTVDEGMIYVKRSKPKELDMLVDFQKPDKKTAAVAGRKVEIYYPKMNTVQEYDAGKNRALLDQFLLLGFGSSAADLQANYTIRATGSDTIGGQKATILELIPKSKEALAHLKKVELWISDSTGLTTQQKFYEAGGDYKLATYTNVQLKPNLPESAVRLNLPKGVKREFPQK